MGVSWAMDSPFPYFNLFIYLVCEFCLWVNSNLGALKMLLLGGSREQSPRIPQALTQGSWAVLLILGWNSKLRPPKRWISLSWMLDTGIHPCPSSLGRSYVSVVGSRASAPQEFISIQTSKVLEGWGRLLTYGPGTRTEIFVRRVDPEGWALSPAKQVSITTALPACSGLLWSLSLGSSSPWPSRDGFCL